MVEKMNSKYKNVMSGQGSECHRLQVKCECCMNAQHVLLIPIICIQVEKLQFWGRRFQTPWLAAQQCMV